jgi:polycystin 2
MSGNQTEVINDLATLQANNWIDRNTRAVFVEFNIYNPNIGIFAYCYLLFEILPTGSFLGSARFAPMTLFDDRNDLYSFTTLAAVIYLIMIFILTFKQVYNIYLHRKKYFKLLWTYLDLSLIAFSFTSFAIWLYRVWEAQSVMSIFASNLKTGNSGGNKFVSLQMLAYWDDTLACMLSFCAALGTVKFFKILAFNRSIKTLAMAFQIGFASTASFTLVFCLMTFAWLQFGFVVFSDRIHDFSTFVKTMETGFQLMMGKFALGDMLQANAVWTIVFHVSFNVFIIFIMFQLFLTLICDALAVAKGEELNSENLRFYEFFGDHIESAVKTVSSLFEKKKRATLLLERQMQKSMVNNDLYQDQIDHFAYTADAVINVMLGTRDMNATVKKEKELRK